MTALSLAAMAAQGTKHQIVLSSDHEQFLTHALSCLLQPFLPLWVQCSFEIITPGLTDDTKTHCFCLLQGGRKYEGELQRMARNLTVAIAPDDFKPAIELEPAVSCFPLTVHDSASLPGLLQRTRVQTRCYGCQCARLSESPHLFLGIIKF